LARDAEVIHIFCNDGSGIRSRSFIMDVNHVITNYTSGDAGRNNIIIIIIVIIIKYSYPARQNVSL
jgi:hypothetical protein